jgi:hypothetical protein
MVFGFVLSSLYLLLDIGRDVRELFKPEGRS